MALFPARRKELFLPLGVAIAMAPLDPGRVRLYFVRFRRTRVSDGREVGLVSSPGGFPGISASTGFRFPSSCMTALLVPIVLAASTAITHRLKEFVMYTLLLEAGFIGVFLALDLFLFFVFFEAILIPMYFVIGIWGGERRVYAAIKFFLYTAFGSALMLAAIIGVAVLEQRQNGVPSFAYTDLLDLSLNPTTARWLFGAFRPRLCDQGADVSVPHLAARCSCRGADGRVSFAGGESC